MPAERSCMVLPMFAPGCLIVFLMPFLAAALGHWLEPGPGGWIGAAVGLLAGLSIALAMAQINRRMRHD